MSTNHHTPYSDDTTRFSAGDMNAPLGELDTAITTVTTEVETARGAEANLDARLDAIELAASGLGSIATYDVWTGGQAAYDALGTYDSNTLYFITGA